MSLFKVLYTWLLPLQPKYTVKDLIEELRNWIKEGYLDSTAWKRLQNCVVNTLLPSFSERSELRQRSLPSEALPIHKDSDSPRQPLDSPTQAASNAASHQSPAVATGIRTGELLMCICILRYSKLQLYLHLVDYWSLLWH